MTAQTEKERADAAELLRAQQEDDFSAVMCTPSGRRFVWRIIQANHTLGASSAGEATHITAFNEGIRATGIRLMEEAKRLGGGKLFVEMWCEAVGVTATKK